MSKLPKYLDRLVPGSAVERVSSAGPLRMVRGVIAERCGSLVLVAWSEGEQDWNDLKSRRLSPAS